MATKMIEEPLQELAALYASGVMTAPERENFELVLACHAELQAFVVGLVEVSALVVSSMPGLAGAGPGPALKSRIMEATRDRPQPRMPEPLVMTGPDGLVRWVNSAFSEMCGYTLEELRGKKLGPILQGAETDRDTVERMRRAVREYRPCRETLLNYHKNGAPYWVEIAITPILDDAGQPRWLVAREREVADPALA